MKVSIVFAILASLLATAGCRTSYVLVTVEVPERLHATLIRVVRTESPSRPQWMKDDRLSTDATESGFVIYQVGIPSDAVGLTLVVQAMSEQELLAEASLRVTDAVGLTLRLSPCPNALKRTPDFQSCQPVTGPMPVNAPLDAGLDVAEAGAQEGGGDVGTAATPPADAAGPESGAACLVADPEAPQPPLPTVSTVSAACQRYCAAMLQNCPAVYTTAARCWYACDVLNWPATGDFMQDTVACRTSHAEAATNPATRPPLCEAASPVLTRACGDLCAVFCRTGARICPSSFPPEALCLSGCAAERERFRQKFRDDPDANVSDDFYSKLWCRNERLEAAIFNRTYCDVAAPNKMCGVCPELNFVP